MRSGVYKTGGIAEIRLYVSCGARLSGNTGILCAGAGNPNPSCDVDGITYEKLPPVSGWPHISADDLDVDTFDGMTLELDFDGTQARKAKVLIRIMKDEETVYEQEAVIHSMYEYQVEEGETAWAAIGAAVLENAVSRAAA